MCFYTPVGERVMFRFSCSKINWLESVLFEVVFESLAQINLRTHR